MDRHEWQAQHFESYRSHLRAVAYRMLGSLSEADDAVQEAWLHFSRSDTSEVVNLGGWLTRVVARICLDMLRSRESRREESLDARVSDPSGSTDEEIDPEGEALLADAVGQALLVVLATLNPAERLAFVLHDIFGMPFEEIAPLVERTPAATRQLASRARRRVQGTETIPDVTRMRQREAVEAFLAASRSGDFEALLSMLDPEVVFRSSYAGASMLVRGAAAVAEQFSGRAREAQAALINGAVAIVVAPHGHLQLAINLTFKHDRISEINVISDPEQLSQLNMTIP
ncbi:sigma-70 family RNA polymerase sigma factor [Dictyobacter aurantiacus]|uniref:DNA-directed RNA polymerase sigma-70 factor n=1 Tax=Dictyobacter aurantiacus TaxID=1936993 RepID=A0A401ZJL0_9CHLR|nr:sigma-70 family RNA polymerase sigma factor [Dictyobacter aurantiacus]GCE07033.1 DNA-directed RNA polymerase sigma-70 factor [Dictyobacter aurantiacus]